MQLYSNGIDALLADILANSGYKLNIHLEAFLNNARDFQKSHDSQNILNVSVTTDV